MFHFIFLFFILFLNISSFYPSNANKVLNESTNTSEVLFQLEAKDILVVLALILLCSRCYTYINNLFLPKTIKLIQEDTGCINLSFEEIKKFSQNINLIRDLGHIIKEKDCNNNFLLIYQNLFSRIKHFVKLNGEIPNDMYILSGQDEELSFDFIKNAFFEMVPQLWSSNQSYLCVFDFSDLIGSPLDRWAHSINRLVENIVLAANRLSENNGVIFLCLEGIDNFFDLEISTLSFSNKVTEKIYEDAKEYFLKKLSFSNKNIVCFAISKKRKACFQTVRNVEVLELKSDDNFFREYFVNKLSEKRDLSKDDAEKCINIFKKDLSECQLPFVEKFGYYLLTKKPSESQIYSSFKNLYYKVLKEPDIQSLISLYYPLGK
jgi:hypothetical protein